MAFVEGEDTGETVNIEGGASLGASEGAPQQRDRVPNGKRHSSRFPIPLMSLR